MDLQRYRHFLAVVDAGHFGRAALALGMRQPPLSQSIARLERDVGARLFERTPRGAMLTPAGEAFLPEARIAVAAAARAVRLAQAAETRIQPLRVGVVSVALFEILAAVFRTAQASGLDLQVDYISTNGQLASLADGRLDLGFVTPPFEAPSRLQLEWIANEPLMVALPPALAGEPGTSVPLEVIYDRLVLFAREDGPVLHDAILAMFRRDGLTPLVVHRTPASILATLALVAASGGASFVPACVARGLTMAGVAFRPLARRPDMPAWPVAMAHMPCSARSPLARFLAAWRARPLSA